MVISAGYRRRRRGGGVGLGALEGVVTDGLVSAYDPVEDVQVFPDLVGNFDLLRGSTAGADTNDPLYDAAARSYRYVIDDRAFGPTADMDGWTWMVAARVRIGNATGTEGRFIDVSDAGVNPDWFGVAGLADAGAAAGKFRFKIFVSGGAGNVFGATDRTPGEWATVAFGKSSVFEATTGTQLWVNKVVDAQASEGGPRAHVAPRLNLGLNCADCDVGSILIYNRKLTTAEVEQNHAVLKTLYPSLPL